MNGRVGWDLRVDSHAVAQTLAASPLPVIGERFYSRRHVHPLQLFEFCPLSRSGGVQLVLHQLAQVGLSAVAGHGEEKHIRGAARAAFGGVCAFLGSVCPAVQGD